MNCNSKLGFEVVKLAFVHFALKTQTSSRFPNDSSRKLLDDIKLREIGVKISE